MLLFCLTPHLAHLWLSELTGPRQNRRFLPPLSFRTLSHGDTKMWTSWQATCGKRREAARPSVKVALASLFAFVQLGRLLSRLVWRCDSLNRFPSSARRSTSPFVFWGAGTGIRTGKPAWLTVLSASHFSSYHDGIGTLSSRNGPSLLCMSPPRSRRKVQAQIAQRRIDLADVSYLNLDVRNLLKTGFAPSAAFAAGQGQGNLSTGPETRSDAPADKNRIAKGRGCKRKWRSFAQPGRLRAFWDGTRIVQIRRQRPLPAGDRPWPIRTAGEGAEGRPQRIIRHREHEKTGPYRNRFEFKRNGKPTQGRVLTEGRNARHSTANVSRSQPRSRR